MTSGKRRMNALTDRCSFYRENPVKKLNIYQTMYSLVKEMNETRSETVAIDFFGTKITFGQLFRRVDRLADACKRSGVKEGDCVGIISINMPVVQECLLALSKIGAISKWIDVRVKESDLIEKINESNCKIVIAFDGVAKNIISVLSKICPEKIVIVSPKDYLKPIVKAALLIKEGKSGGDKNKIRYDNRIIRYKDFINSGNERTKTEPVRFVKERPALIIQSSGSTGRSKSILHTEYNLNSEMLKESFSDLPFADGKRMHISVPPFIIYGLCNSVYAALVFSMTAVMTPYVREEAIFDDLGKFDFACGAPFHFRYIFNRIVTLKYEIEMLKENGCDSERKSKEKELSKIMCGLYSVSAFICGGDKIAPQELLNMEHVFNTPIINGYGNNEMCGAAILSPLYAMKPDSTGVPLKGVEVHSFDTESGDQLPIDVIGEICMRSDSMFIEYINNPTETARIKQKHADGKEWIHTGDLGYIDSDGFVFITGRTKRLIKMDGFKIAPETIETVVLEIEEVKDCVVVGVPDEKHVEVPMLFCEKQEGSNLTDESVVEIVMKRCHEALPEYEIPKYIEVINGIPHKNGKHDFISLSIRGKEYVQSLP